MAEVVSPRTEPRQEDGEHDELDDVLRQVNRIRVTHGADPIYALPTASPAMTPGSSCVLQEAFADIGVATVDYYELRGRGLRVEHGLGWFIRRYDDGAFPDLVRPK